MRVSDSTMVVSAIFHLAEANGSDRVSPGEITSYLGREFGLTVPLHQVSEIINDLGLITHPVKNVRYIVWNQEAMLKLRTAVSGSFNIATANTANVDWGIFEKVFGETGK